jgi:hypothetical protein
MIDVEARRFAEFNGIERACKVVNPTKYVQFNCWPRTRDTEDGQKQMECTLGSKHERYKHGEQDIAAWDDAFTAGDLRATIASIVTAIAGAGAGRTGAMATAGNATAGICKMANY